MFYRFSLNKLLIRLGIILAISGAFGYLSGLFWPALFFSVLSILLWHYRQLVKLVNWLWNSKTILPPEGSGSWSHIYDGIYGRIKRYKKRQKELNKVVRRFRDGAEAMPDAAIVLDADFDIRWSNKKAAKLIGIRWPTDEGQRIDNLIRSPIFSKYLEKANYNKTCSLPSPINSDIQLELRFMSYGIDGLLILIRDVSQINRLEEMRRDFVANVSHELKTPLTVVRGYVEMIQSTDVGLDQQWQQAFSTIELQVTRMDRLVEQLLILSRVEAHSENVLKTRINMPVLIEQLAEDANWLNQDKHHNITLSIDKSFGVVGVETEIKSACSNLIANAIAYTPSEGEIHICWQRKGSQMCFTVTDNGPGIKPEHINRLTERFYRVDKSRSRNTGGSGLGLAIVKHVLHHHNAELRINSQWNEGSDFSIYFDSSDTVNL